MFGGYYKGRRVLVTGHSGFKGGWLSLWLKNLGAKVCGLGLSAPTRPNFYEVIASHAFAQKIPCDVRQFDPLVKALKKVRPEIIFHLAAQPIMRRSYAEPLETFQTNAL